MNLARIDTLARSLTTRTSRRELVTLLGGGLHALGSINSSEETTAAKRDGKRRRTRKRREKRRRRNDDKQPPSTPPPPELVTRVDARCFGSSDIDFGAVENSRLAQTFTALTSGALVRVELTVAKDENALDEWALSLSPIDTSGQPTNEILAESIVPDASVPLDEAAVVSFEFASPFRVVAGTTYALVLSHGEFFRWSARDGDICQGQAFHSATRSAPFIETDRDFIYTTFVSS